MTTTVWAGAKTSLPPLDSPQTVASVRVDGIIYVKGHSGYMYVWWNNMADGLGIVLVALERPAACSLEYQ